MLVIRGSVVHSLGPDDLELLTEQAIVIDPQGTITYFGPVSGCPQPDKTATVINLSPTQFVTPGFVDAHIHAPQYPITGVFSETLLDWLNKYTFPLESKFENHDIAQKVYSKTVTRTLQNGTTTASYFGTVHTPATLTLAKSCLNSGQRALVGRVCMERFCPESLQDANIESDIEHIDSVQSLDPQGEMLKPIITPRFAPSCTRETLHGLGKLARERNLPVQTHLSENAGEIELVGNLFPEAENYTDVYARAGLLKQDTVLAHSIHLSQKEIELVKRYQSGLVHCPYSNAALVSGIAPVKEYLNQGVKVGLGTDVGAGATMSILINMRLALLNSNLLAERNDGLVNKYSLTLANAVYLATLGGATVCGLEHRIGNFEVGKQFDAQLIDVLAADSPIDLFEFQLPAGASERLDHYVRKWIYVGDDRNTLQVWVDGRTVHKRVH